MPNDGSETKIADQDVRVHITNKVSFVRWQAMTIAQLGFASNLIFGLSVAVLGFEVTLLLNGTYEFGSFLPKFGFLLSLIAVAVSIGLGIWLVINRLRDFRATEKVARLREKNRPDSEIAPYRADYEKFSKMTWRLFNWQIGIFTLGLVFFFLSIVLPAASKLF
jgi:hypothetical protein